MLSRSGVIQKESLTERMPPRMLRRPAKLVDDRRIRIKSVPLGIVQKLEENVLMRVRILVRNANMYMSAAGALLKV